MHFDKDAYLSLLAEWNRCHGAFYQLDPADLLWNLQQQNLVSYHLEKMAGVNCLLGVTSPQGVKAGLPERSCWLSLCGEIPHSVTGEFVRSLENWARGQKKARLNFFGDEFHFLPGIPLLEEAGVRLQQVLLKNGFEGSESVDFVGELNTLPVKNITHAALLQAQKNSWEFREAAAVDLKQLEDFLSREFPGRWLREFRFWQSHTDTKRASWWQLNKQNGEIFGFARLSVRGRINNGAWNPGALRLPLTEDAELRAEDGCLGPIGVAATARGQGAGKTLLGLSLSVLSDLRAARACIDWTDAYNYYKPLEFSVVRKYWSAWKRYLD